MASTHTITYKDFTGQLARMTVHIQQLTAANYDAVSTDLAALRTALDALTIGNLQRYQTVANVVRVSDGKASELMARRENKIALTYEDDVTHELYTVELPCADISDDAAFWEGANSEYVDTSHALWTALETAWADVVESKAGNATTLRSGRFVGRNL